MWGEYISHTRAEIQTEDRMGWALVPKYFSSFVYVDMIIDPTFDGIFSMTFNANNQYTHKSQYLQHCYLDGVNNSGLQGNDEYNRLKGNSGNNLTTCAIVTDGISNRDGVDTLRNMHFLQFNDQTIPISLQSTLEVEGIYDEPVEVSLFPNPANNQIELQLGEISSKSVVEIFDLNGRRLILKNFQQSNNLKIDVSEFSIFSITLCKNNSIKSVLLWIIIYYF